MESIEKIERVREKLKRELGAVIGSALADPLVVEVMLNPDGKLWVERLGEPMKEVGEMRPSNAEALMATIASSLSTTITREKPYVEGELPTDGSRFEGTLPPIVPGPSFTIRKKASRVFTLEEYVRSGIMTDAQRLAVVEAVRALRNILVVGGTGSGKTTFLNAVISALSKESPNDRLIIIEDTVELQCSSPNVVQMRTSDTVTMQNLLRITMRYRPDRILVGEVRGAEALALVKAWNTGHPGGLATIHANNAAAGLVRVAQLIEEGLQGGDAKPRVIAEAVGLIVVIAKVSTAPGRRITEMVSVKGHENGRYILEPVLSAS